MLYTFDQGNNGSYLQQRRYALLLSCKKTSSHGRMPRVPGCHVFSRVEKTDGITKLADKNKIYC